MDPEHGGNKDGAAEAASGEWGTIQRELREEDHAVYEEASGILLALIGRVRERKALRALGVRAVQSRASA